MAKAKKSKKNENGEGTLRKRPNGTFEYRIIYDDEYGISKRKSFYGQSDVVCKEKAEKFLFVLEKKKIGIDATATIPEIIKAKYDSDLEKNYVHEQGYSRNMANLGIIERSAIGNIPIAELTEYHLDMFLHTLTKYSNSTIGKVFLQLRMAYREACNRGIIKKDLMLSYNLRCPKSNKPDKKVYALTQNEQKEFVKFLQTYKSPNGRNDYRVQLLIELYSGLRMGEINALKPENIDFDKGVIHVKSTISRGKNFQEFIKDGTKTYAGVRDVPIMESLKPILLKAINCKSENPYGLLFYDNIKNKLISTSQVNCFFYRVCEKCGIDKRGQHALRHTFATRCIEADIPPVVLKKWLGHTDIHITLDTYADVFDSMHNDSITKLDNHINKISEKKVNSIAG